MTSRRVICEIARTTARNRARYDEELCGRLYDVMQAAGYRAIDSGATTDIALIDAMAEACRHAEAAYFRPVA